MINIAINNIAIAVVISFWYDIMYIIQLMILIAGTYNTTYW